MSIFLIYASTSNLKFLLNESKEILGFFAFFQGVYVSFCITGIFAFFGLIFPLYRILPENYYKVNNVKTIKKLYFLLKVDWFGYFLTKTFYKPRQKRTTFFNGKKEGLEGFYLKTEESEFNHLIPLLLLLIISGLLILYKQYQVVLYISLVNIFLNFYPIILQRFHRIRLQKFIS